MKKIKLKPKPKSPQHRAVLNLIRAVHKLSEQVKDLRTASKSVACEHRYAVMRDGSGERCIYCAEPPSAQFLADRQHRIDVWNDLISGRTSPETKALASQMNHDLAELRNIAAAEQHISQQMREG